MENNQNPPAPTEREKELLGVIDELQKKLDEKPEASISSGLPKVTHKGKTYEVTCKKFIFERKEYTIEALKDAKLLAKLIEAQVGFLREVK
ncbi:hypothetical protein [Runella zeae]|uniref:hypothetical protein n=1 Tax=Runella zeae TaxID=94255 RepID=UPI00040F5273|nr:hypothetical protein [Runella zeae]